MNEESKKQLFFLVSPQQDLRTVSAFLSKRGFSVHFESDVRDALLKIIELQPEFTFLAWDHKDKKVATLPKLIARASATVVVPFISTNTNEAIIKFSNCPLNPKLFPPISGPAVERLILKSSKEDSDYIAKQSLIKSQLKNKEDLLLLQQKMIQDLDLETSQELETNFPTSAGGIERADDPPAKKEKSPGVIIQKGFQTSQGPGFVIQKAAVPVGLGTVREKPKFRAYCISIVSQKWSGYFVIATKAPLDFDKIHLIFSEWINVQLGSAHPINEQDFFEFDSVEQSQMNEIKRIADYSENIQVEDFDVEINFFAVESKAMQLEFTDDRSYLKIKTADVPVLENLKFNLLVYLPENKKYVVYTQGEAGLEPEKKDRLLKNKIETLYISAASEREYRKFLANKNFTGIYQKINAKLGAV